MRRLYIVDPGVDVTQEIREAAVAAGCTEIVRGIPSRLVGLVTNPYPIAFDEPEDPEATPRRAAAGVCQNFLTDGQVDAFLAAANGTATAAQRDAIIKDTIRAVRAHIVLSRREYRELVE